MARMLSRRRKLFEKKSCLKVQEGIETRSLHLMEFKICFNYESIFRNLASHWHKTTSSTDLVPTDFSYSKLAIFK